MDRRALCLALACMLVASACVLPGRGHAPRRPDGPVVGDPEAWERVNASLVQEYLATLPASQRGMVLTGILLSDGSRWFDGYTYLGAPTPEHPGLQVRLLRDPRGKVRAYLRLDEGSEPYSLPTCEGTDSPGIRARQLTGEVHAWYALKPEQGFIYTVCPPTAWLEQVGAATGPPAS